jgi:hypothetical protein
MLIGRVAGMASEEQFEARLTHVEHEVRLARADAADARVLACGADRDVDTFATKLAVQKRLVEAVRGTQVTHTEQLRTIDQRVDKLEAEVREGFARQALGQHEITVLLNRILDTDK